MASFSTSGLLLLVGIVNKSLTVINMLLQYFNMDIWIYLAFDMCTNIFSVVMAWFTHINSDKYLE